MAEGEKISLPEETQIEIMRFFLRTSVPRILREEREQADIEAAKQPQSENIR